MSYSGTGANRTPLGRLNPILLGRKRTNDNEPSLLSHHLRNREQGQSQPGGFGSYDDYGVQEMQFSGNEGQQYDRGNVGYEQRGQYNQGPQSGFDQRGPNQAPYNQRGHQPVDQRHPQQFDGRSVAQYDQRGGQSYDNRANTPFDSSMSGMNYEQRHGVPPAPQPQVYDMGQRSFQQANGSQGGAQRGPPPPQPLMAANIGPLPQRSLGPPGQGPGPNGLLGMPPDMASGGSANQSFATGGFPGGVLGAPRLGSPSVYTEMKREAGDSPARKKRKKSRWGDEDKKTSVPGMPATMPKDMTEEQTKQYLMHFKIEEISMRLRTGDLGIPDNPEDRSPSPEPIYNSEGKRLNTREFRVRKCLEEERHNLIQEAMKCNPDYKPPADYKPPSTRIQEKVMIPQDANPAINFIGLLIGPRGNTLKKMEKETNCKIIIRGKGSVKEGKGRAGMPLPGEDEPLHALVTGPTHEDVRKAVNTISKIIKEGIETPEGSNELRKMQLRELAALNGTLIEEDLVRCRNCGSNEHRHWECTEQKNVTHAVVCTKCGGHGHIASDCVMSGNENIAKAPSISERAKMDDEYMSLMAELGVDAPPGSGKPPSSTVGGPTQGKEVLQSSRGQAPWNQNHNNQGGAWNYGKKDAQSVSHSQPPPLMSQSANPPAFTGKSGSWIGNAPGTPGQLAQVPNTQSGAHGTPGHGGMPQPLMSIPGHVPPAQSPQSQAPVSASQAIPPLMGASGPSVVPPLPGMAAPPPPPPSSSAVSTSVNAQVSQAPPPPWQTPLPPWQAAPVPQQDPMAAFMPMMYPPVAPPVGMTPPSTAPLPPWMAAPPPPPPPPPSS